MRTESSRVRSFPVMLLIQVNRGKQTEAADAAAPAAEHDAPTLVPGFSENKLPSGAQQEWASWGAVFFLRTYSLAISAAGPMSCRHVLLEGFGALSLVPVRSITCSTQRGAAPKRFRRPPNRGCCFSIL